MVFEGLKKRLEENRLKKKSSLDFKREVEADNLKVRRDAFREEALIQAKDQGKRLAVQQANRPSFSERVAGAAKSTGKFLVTPQRQSPQRQRVPVKRSPVRKAAKKKTSRARSSVKKEKQIGSVFGGMDRVFN